MATYFDNFTPRFKLTDLNGTDKYTLQQHTINDITRNYVGFFGNGKDLADSFNFWYGGTRSKIKMLGPANTFYIKFKEEGKDNPQFFVIFYGLVTNETGYRSIS